MQGTSFAEEDTEDPRRFLPLGLLYTRALAVLACLGFRARDFSI